MNATTPNPSAAKAKTTSSQTEQAANDAAASASAAAQHAAETLTQTAENISMNAANMMQAGAQTWNDMYGEFSKIAREQSEKTSKNVADSVQDINNTLKSNMNCFAQAVNIYARSCENISRETFGFLQNMFENNITATKNLMACRNAQEAVDIQTNLAKNNIENLVTECTRISQMAFDAANKSFQPIQEQINQNVDRMSRAAA